MSGPAVAVYVDPITRHFESDRLFALDTAARGGDDILAPWVHLKEWFRQRGIVVRTADALDDGQPRADVNVFVSFGQRERYRRLEDADDVVLSAFFALECPVVEPRLYLDLSDVSSAFRRMFSFSNGDALGPYLREPMAFHQFRLPQPFDDVHEDVWSRRDRLFLTIINANKLPRISLSELYTERLRAIEYFNRYGEIDLYGVGWDGPPYRMGATRVPATVRRVARQAQIRWERIRPTRDPLRVAAQQAYRGAVDSKAATLGRYDYAICFENMVLEGWVTEKIFDCFLAGTIPVYLGAPDIERWVPAECFVDMRRFADYGELRDYLRSIGPEDRDAYRTAARDYLRSEQFRPFTKEAFAELIGSIVEEDAGVRL